MKVTNDSNLGAITKQTKNRSPFTTGPEQQQQHMLSPQAGFRTTTAHNGQQRIANSNTVYDSKRTIFPEVQKHVKRCTTRKRRPSWFRHVHSRRHSTAGCECPSKELGDGQRAIFDYGKGVFHSARNALRIVQTLAVASPSAMAFASEVSPRTKTSIRQTLYGCGFGV